MVVGRKATTPKALWLLVIVGPVITAIQHEIMFILVRPVCSAQATAVLYGITLLAMALTIGSIIVGNGIRKRASEAWPGDGEDLETRVTFIAILGMLSSVISLHIMVAQFIATVVLHPCQL